MDKGNKNRATGATLMNKDSSRSHSIFTIVTEMCTRSQLDGKDHIRAGKLNLVDLAGSERQSKTRENKNFLHKNLLDFFGKLIQMLKVIVYVKQLELIYH
jgi:hypothetical protein